MVQVKKITRLLLAFFAVSCIITLQLNATLPAKEKKAEIVIDVETGRILHSYKSDHIRHPASLTKLMTLYLMFESIDNGRFTPDSRVIFSRYATSKPPSKLGIRVGGSISMRDAAYTLIIRSANDVATAVGETISGSEANFARLMTLKARKLGMTRTVFHNASGLPDIRQVTTARDMAVLGLRLMQHYPHYYKYFATLNKTVAGIPLRTHNHLLKTYKGMDGLKTGFVNMSGFNLVSSAERNSKRLITVVMGGESYRSRDNRVATLMNLGWEKLKNPRGYRQFIGISMPQLVALKTSFRPLEAKQPRAIMTASLVENTQGHHIKNIQKVLPIKTKNNSLQYHLNKVSNVQKGGEWIENSEAEVPTNDEIANLIEKSQKEKTINRSRMNYFQPIPVDDALLYNKKNNNFKYLEKSTEKILKLPNYNSSNVNNNVKLKNASIQVGAFSKKNAADNYLNELMKKYDNFSDAHPELVAVKRGNDYIYRARFKGFTPEEAKQACGLLKKMGRYCMLSDSTS